MDARRFNELIVFVIRQTGWTLEYIRSLPLPELTTIVHHLGYLHHKETYELGSYSALPALMQAKKGTRLTDLIGDPPGKEMFVETNLAKESQISTIILADGKEYELSPLDLNKIADIEDKFDKPYGVLINETRMKVLRYILYMRLKDKYALAEDQVGKLVTVHELTNISKMAK